MSNLPLGPEPKKVEGLQAESCNDCGKGKPLSSWYHAKQRLRLCEQCANYRDQHSTPKPSATRTAENPGPAQRLSPSQELLRYFAYRHLPEPLRQVSSQLFLVAHSLENHLPDGPEKTAGLRKLLEAKDCFVRAALPKEGYPLIEKED